MKAIVVPDKDKQPVLVQDAEKPTPKEDQVLVKTKVVALNPVDWKMVKYKVFIDSYPTILGGDVAGVVESLGPNVARYKPGDEIYGFAQLGRGTFAEYAVLHHDLSALKPAHISFEQAATIPIACWTAGLALFDKLGLETPSRARTPDVPRHVLVWGGASSVGAYAIQLAKLAKCTVTTTCSPKNFEYVRSIGATHTIDYHSSDVVEQIRTVTGGALHHAIDCISSETAEQCARALATSSAAAADEPVPTVVLVVGKADSFAPTYPQARFEAVLLASAYSLPDVFLSAARIVAECSALLNDKALQPNPLEVLAGGLAGIPEGLKRLEAGVSGVKLVSVVEQTT